jgi:hypothetical protein
MTARIHEWCGRLDDPASERCPCAASRTTVSEVQARHRKAVRGARARDWAGNAGDITRPRVIGEHFGKRRAA